MVEKASCCPLICTHDYICFASANEILADALQAEVWNVLEQFDLLIGISALSTKRKRFGHQFNKDTRKKERAFIKLAG
jgi:hypothetical protein